MLKNFVSILIVSYNAEKYIEKTIRSCLNQSYKDIEVLLLDNGSHDRTIEVVNRLRLEDSRLKLFISKKNLGPYRGLNFLLERAIGEYIAIQDHDDVWFFEKIERQVNFLKNNEVYVACGTNTFYFYEKHGVLILNKKPKIVNFVDHTSLLFRNEGFRYKPGHSLSDEYFEKKTLSTKGAIACLQEGLTVHRIKSDGTNLSSSRFSFSIKQMRDFLSVNGVSFMYFFDLVSRKYLPERFIWFVRKKITQKRSQWITVDDFKKKYPMLYL